MAINPITVERLKTFVLVGHSNADGWAATSKLFTNYDDYLPGTSLPLSNPASAYWKNIYVATSAQPFPEPYHTPVASSVGDVQWLELTVSNPLNTPTDPHPHPSPYTFPNNRGSCYPNWMYDAGSAYSNAATGTLHGIEIPLAWFWHHHWNEQVGIVKMAFSSTFLMQAEIGGDPAAWLDAAGYGASSQNTPADATYVRTAVNPAEGFYGWWTPAEQFDWAPGTDRLYKKWLDKMEGAQAALATDTKMDVRLLVIWMGDNESLGRSRDVLDNDAFYKACKTLRDKMRQACVDNDWTTLPAHQIPVVWIGVHSGYESWSPAGSVDFCNGELARLAKDDPYMRLISPESFATITDDGLSAPFGIVNPSNHYGSDGYVQAAKDVYDAFQEIEVEPFDAIAEEDRITLSEVKDRVRTYYNRARVQTDVDDDTVLIHINGALNSLLGAIGDNAWWLRRRHMMDLEFSVTEPVEMPKYVNRVIKIERPTNPKFPIQFTQVGFASGGKLQILVQESPGGNVYVDYIYRPRDLTRDDELVPLPRQYVEWLCVEACRRLARSGSNVALQASLEGEARTLQERCMKDMAVMQRAKHDRLRTQRRNVTLGYRRGIQYPWGNDISR